MNFGLRDGLSLCIYDKKNNLLAEIDYLKDAILDEDKLVIRSEIISDELLKLLYDSKNESSLFYSVRNRFKKKYKLIAITRYINEYDGMPHIVQYRIHKAKIIKRPRFLHDPWGEPNKFEVVFKILPTGKQRKLFDIKIAEQS